MDWGLNLTTLGDWQDRWSPLANRPGHTCLLVVNNSCSMLSKKSCTHFELRPNPMRLLLKRRNKGTSWPCRSQGYRTVGRLPQSSSDGLCRAFTADSRRLLSRHRTDSERPFLWRLCMDLSHFETTPMCGSVCPVHKMCLLLLVRLTCMPLDNRLHENAMRYSTWRHWNTDLAENLLL